MKLRQALALHQSGQLDQARPLYEAVLKAEPKNADALHLLGVVAAQSGDHQRAAELIAKAIAVNPNNAAFHFNRGAALQKLGRAKEAIASYDKTLQLKPDFVEAHRSRGDALQTLDRPDEAIASYDRAIALRRDNAEAYNNRGNALLALGRRDEALASFESAIRLKPGYAEAYGNRAIALAELKRFDAAIADYDEALAINPLNAEAHSGRGDALTMLKRFEEALASYENVLALDQTSADALFNRANALANVKRFTDAVAGYDLALAAAPNNERGHRYRGLALMELQHFDLALASFDRALELEPFSAESQRERGRALTALKRFEDAIASYDQALAAHPPQAETYNNRGVALQALHRFDEALTSYNQALAFDPDNVEAFSNRGNALQELARYDEALACYDSALALQPDTPGLHKNRGVALQALRRMDEAIASFEAALAAEPDFLFGAYLHAKMQICDWNALPENLRKLEAAISCGKKATPPFAALTLLDKPDLLLKAAQIWVADKCPHPDADRAFPKREARGKIRIGYYSADFQEHATTHLIAEMMEQHDRERFELIGFSFGADSDDRMRQRISAAFDRFIDIKTQSDREVAALSVQLGIDIAVDLKGFTSNSRPGLFAARCAPIQVNYLGYPATMGADFIDYIIADTILIPAEHQTDFSERVVYLPPSYQPNDSQRKISERIFTKQELGLPETGFVFCAFNNTFKIFPQTFDSWMRILKAVDGSVLWLLEDNPFAAKNLRERAEASGVDAGRLVFAPRMAPAEHLARQRIADLFLDTLPCCAHTTASDALWAGLPLLTFTGQTFAGRVAASLLHALDLPELVTDNSEEYEAKAIALATDADALAALKERLARARPTAPLFQGKAIARKIEAAYEAMIARREAGLPPGVIEIQ